MVELIKNGNEKIFIYTCMHCVSDFSFNTSDIRKRVEYKYDESTYTIFDYAVVCPQCGEITRVGLTQFKE